MSWGNLSDAVQTVLLTACAEVVWLALTGLAVMLACRDKDEEIELSDTWW
ncbi:MAG: hypothetical protein JOZ00_03315 [Mycobacterium sp.]|nr:hypothetical protein [Mycobacterium sp.]